MIDYIDIHTHRFDKNENNISLLNVNIPFDNLPQNIYLSIGCHPWFIESVDLEQIRNTLDHSSKIENVIAFGECGIDRLIRIPFEKQITVLRIHLEMAIFFNKPLIIHCVKSYSDLLELLKKYSFKGKLVLHNFNGNQHLIDQFLKYDTFFSFSKSQILNNIKFNKKLSNLPLEKIFFETDNSNFSIEETYNIGSVYFASSLEKLKNKTKQNFSQLFKIDTNTLIS